MAKKIKVYKNALVTLALAVPSGTTADSVVLLGSVGLKGFSLTPEATSETVAKGTSAPGLAVGEASVRLIGVSLVVELPIAAAINQYAKVYKTAEGTYTGVASTNTFIGYALDTLAAAGNARVALTIA